MKRFISLLFIPVDLVVSLFYWTEVAFLLLSKKRGNRGQEFNAVFVVFGAGIEAIHKKYGTLNVYLEDNPGCFDRVYRVLLGKNNCELALRENFFITEINVTNRYFRFTSFARLTVTVIKKALIGNTSLIHAKDPYICGFSALVAARILRIPFCISIHADYEKRESLQKGVIPRILGSLKISRLIEKTVYRHAKMIFPIRESIIAHLLEVGCQRNKVKVFTHGIDMGLFSKPKGLNMRLHFGIPDNCAVATAVARLEKENYCEDIIKIALGCVKSRRDIYFVICGGGSKLEELRRSIKEQGLDNRILLPGYIAHDLIVEVWKQADIALCLMGGFSLLEACAGARPVIAYDVEWHYELVRNNETGFLVKESDTEAAIEKIIYLLEHPDMARELGEKANALVKEKNSLAAVSAEKSKYYRMVVE